MMRDTIRLVNSRDYSKIQIKAWLNADKIKKVKESINNPSKLVFVAIDDDGILGIASFNLKDKELGSLYIKYNCHEKGIGTKLLKYVERYAKNIGLKKLKLGSTITAFEFYKKHGYSTITRKHCVILDGVKIPCILMSKRL